MLKHRAINALMIISGRCRPLVGITFTNFRGGLIQVEDEEQRNSILESFCSTVEGTTFSTSMKPEHTGEVYPFANVFLQKKVLFEIIKLYFPF